MKNAWIIGALALVAGCRFNQSASVDLTTGVTTKGNGLSCDVVLSGNDKQVDRTTFVYAEKIGIHFNNIEGFTRKGKQVFPGMKLVVVSKDGDTLLNDPDLYATYPKPITMQPLALFAEFTVQKPMKPGKAYKVYVHVWDKKGKGTFDAEFDMNVIADPAIATKTTGASYDFIYLYDQGAKESITYGKIRPNQEVYVLFEGLKGFNSKEGMSEVGMSMIAKDKKGRVLLNEPDLMKDKPVDSKALGEQFVGIVRFPGGDNPITLETEIWDKLGTAKVQSTVRLELEQ